MSHSTDPPARILIVDDEPRLLEVLTAMLEAEGYSVETAGDGRAAVRILGQRPFDLVLTDIMMPGLDGLQLLRAVRERDLDVPVVLMTGNPNVESAAQALEYGALRYLTKPLRERDLLRATADAVTLHRLARLKRQALEQLGSRNKLLGDRAGLEVGFGRALASLQMAFQPIVRAGDGALFGYEALVRTGEPALAEPEALFEAAERLGRVQELGRVIRESVARTMRTGSGRVSVFVNVHTQELADDNLFAAGLGLAGTAKDVVLEITERAPLDGLVDVRTRVEALRGLGYRLAIDDLGAGYAGLTSFAALEPEVVKLDMGLVRGVHEQAIKQRLVGSITALCKELGILVVGEGVETRAERDALAQLGCDLLQGFLFGRPATSAHS